MEDLFLKRQEKWVNLNLVMEAEILKHLKNHVQDKIEEDYGLYNVSIQNQINLLEEMMLFYQN